MKSDLKSYPVRVDATLLRNFAAEVKETIATGFETAVTAKTAFGVADLWNIQKNSKTANSRLRKHGLGIF